MTLEATGSDQHRVCLTRLCCAFRLSQPRDALFLPQPFWLCFTPVTPSGFPLQRFSLPRSRCHLSALLPLLALSSGAAKGLCRPGCDPQAGLILAVEAPVVTPSMASCCQGVADVSDLDRGLQAGTFTDPKDRSHTRSAFPGRLPVGADVAYPVPSRQPADHCWTTFRSRDPRTLPTPCRAAILEHDLDSAGLGRRPMETASRLMCRSLT
jgi:hypothetical protein